jgi:hypothetical protein
MGWYIKITCNMSYIFLREILNDASERIQTLVLFLSVLPDVSDVILLLLN